MKNNLSTNPEAGPVVGQASRVSGESSNSSSPPDRRAACPSRLRGILSLWPMMLLLTTAPAALALERYVNVNNPSPAAPYTTWASAATNIQDAVDAAVAGDQIVVTNGLYATSGRAVYGTMTNRVSIDKAVTVRSVDGTAVTSIEGR